MTATRTLTVGDMVVVAARGPWFGHTGQIVRIDRSPDTDLQLYNLDLNGDTGVFYADELAPTPASSPEWQVPDGPPRHIIRIAQQAGWTIHIASVIRMALISGPGMDGHYLRISATHIGGDTWTSTTERFDGDAQPIDRLVLLGTTDQLEQTIVGHGHPEVDL